VADVDPEQPVYSVRMMEERVAQSIAPQRATSLLITTFSLLALVLASIGLYGVIAYGVAHRSRELAIRTALGARPADLARLVLQHGFLLVLPGLLIGLGAALAFMRVLASLLFGVEPGDAMTLALACMSIILIALAACWSPARRATRTDPMYAMRA
jgi:putative ABC transport system permease protein